MTDHSAVQPVGTVSIGTNTIGYYHNSCQQVLFALTYNSDGTLDLIYYCSDTGEFTHRTVTPNEW